MSWCSFVVQQCHNKLQSGDDNILDRWSSVAITTVPSRVWTVHKKWIRPSTRYYVHDFGWPRTRSDLPGQSCTVIHLQTLFSSRIFAKCMLQISYLTYCMVCKCYLQLLLFFCFISINWTLLRSLFCLFLFSHQVTSFLVWLNIKQANVT